MNFSAWPLVFRATYMFRFIYIAFGSYAVAVAATAFAAWVYYDALETSLKNDREAGHVRLSEATGLLRGQLDTY